MQCSGPGDCVSSPSVGVEDWLWCCFEGMRGAEEGFRLTGREGEVEKMSVTCWPAATASCRPIRWILLHP